MSNQKRELARDMALRQARLLEIDAIERFWGITPRTAELRSWYKAEKCGIINKDETTQPRNESAKCKKPAVN